MKLVVICHKSEPKKHSIRFYADTQFDPSIPNAFESIYVSKLAMLATGLLKVKTIKVTIEEIEE
jgi:hypothetical protein